MKTKTAVLWLLCIAILLAGARVSYWTFGRTPTAQKPRAQLVARNSPIGGKQALPDKLAGSPVIGNSPIKWMQVLPDQLISSPVIGNDGSIYTATFGGAILDAERNVFQALDSISPFAFAFGPRNWSPIVSDIKITPGGPYDLEQILQYDTQIQRLVTIGTLLKVKPFSEYFATLAYFRLNDNPVQSDFPVPQPPGFVPFEQPLSNQIRALVGYGSETRKGFNFLSGLSYDFTNKILQNQVVQVSYNGGCCGLAVSYHRINLGQVRTENQFRVALTIANIGTFGNLRRQEKIF